METNCKSELRFSVAEKIIAAIPFNGNILIGAYGMYLSNWILALAYLIFIFGGFIVMMRYVMCPRCPYLLEGDDCLNAPVALVKKIISKKRQGPLNVYEKVFTKVMKYSPVIIPLYWLIPRWHLFIPFVLFYAIGQLTFTFHFCKNCENRDCVQNRKSSACS